jgi:hypothetical protein
MGKSSGFKRRETRAIDFRFMFAKLLLPRQERQLGKLLSMFTLANWTLP